jgi:hypothetical protein
MGNCAMHRTALKALLDRDGIRDDSYNLEGGFLSDRISMEHGPGGWSVFYVEQGERSDERFFDNESDACQYLHEWITRILSARRRDP